MFIAMLLLECIFLGRLVVHETVVFLEHLRGLLLDPLRDQDVGVKESLDAVLEAVLSPGVQPGAGLGRHANVPALGAQLGDDALENKKGKEPFNSVSNFKQTGFSKPNPKWCKGSSGTHGLIAA